MKKLLFLIVVVFVFGIFYVYADSEKGTFIDKYKVIENVDIKYGNLQNCSVCRLMSGDYIVYKPSDGAYIRMGKDNKLIWTKYTDSIISILPSDDYGYYIYQSKSFSVNQIKVQKFDDLDNLENEYIYEFDSKIIFFNVTPTNDSGTIIAGAKMDSKGNSDAFAFKIDGDGVKQWEKAYNIGNVSVITDVIPENDGYSFILTLVDKDSFTNGAILKVDDKGNEISKKIYGDVDNQIFFGNAQQINDDILIIGSKYQNVSTHTNAHMVYFKIDKSGELAWSHDLELDVSIFDLQLGEIYACGDGYLFSTDKSYIVSNDGKIIEESNNDVLFVKGNGNIIIGNEQDASTELAPLNNEMTIKPLIQRYVKTKPITVILNNKELEFDAKPYISNGHTLVPMRTIFEKIGASVQWDDKGRLVTAQKGELTIKLTIGSNEAVIIKDGKQTNLTIDVPPTIKNGRTFVPLRFISESMGYGVTYDGVKRQVIIGENGTGNKSNDVQLKDSDTNILAKGPSTALTFEVASDGLTLINFDGVINVMRKRLFAKGYTECIITKYGDNSILIQFPTEINIDKNDMERYLTAKAILKFVDPDGEVVLDSNDIEFAENEFHVVNQNSPAKSVVSMTLNDDGVKKFTEATKRLSEMPDGKNYITIMLDGKAISSPRVKETIESKDVVIEGNFTEESAMELAALIRAGSLQYDVKMVGYEVTK